MAFDLTSFFKDPDWFHRFDEYVLAQGKKLSSPRFLSALNLEKVDDGYLLTARSDEYDAEINLWPESDSRWVHFVHTRPPRYSAPPGPTL